MRITKREALLIFQKEHPEYELVIYGAKKKPLDSDLKERLIIGRKDGLSLRDLAVKYNISHEQVRILIGDN